MLTSWDCLSNVPNVRACHYLLQDQLFSVYGGVIGIVGLGSSSAFICIDHTAFMGNYVYASYQQVHMGVDLS